MIDESSNPSAITLTCTAPFSNSPASVIVSGTTTSINIENNIKLDISNSIPLPIDSNIKVIIPPDFGVQNVNTVSLTGVQFRSPVVYNFDASTRTLVVEKFNTAYKQPGNFFLNIGPVVNPPKTEPTESFRVYFTDNNGNDVE